MGSAVTVFMDVPKDERGEVMFSPTPAPAAKSAGNISHTPCQLPS